jgi:hypothetical protein
MPCVPESRAPGAGGGEDAERSRAMRRAYAWREFDEPGWSKWRVYSWIAYLDRSQICAIENRRNLCGLQAYGRPCVDREPEKTLLRALQEGELKAIDHHGGEIPADYWLGKEARDIGDDVTFRRADVLQVWPDPRTLHPAPDQALSLHGKALDEALDKWAGDRWGNDLTKLPNRAGLLLLARTRPEFRNVSQQDIRTLRGRLAPDEIKRGGARMHRRPKT